MDSGYHTEVITFVSKFCYPLSHRPKSAFKLWKPKSLQKEPGLCWGHGCTPIFSPLCIWRQEDILVSWKLCLHIQTLPQNKNHLIPNHIFLLWWITSEMSVFNRLGQEQHKFQTAWGIQLPYVKKSSLPKKSQIIPFYYFLNLTNDWVV